MTDIRAALEALADQWDAEARPLLIVRSMLQNTEGWALQRAASDLRAALAAASPEPVLCEHYEPGDCPICDQPAPAARADERTRLGGCTHHCEEGHVTADEAVMVDMERIHWKERAEAAEARLLALHEDHP